MEFQVCLRNEYGQESIMSAGLTFEQAIKEAKRLVTDDNMENSLTMDEKKKNWTSYFVEFLNEEGEIVQDVIYAGSRGPDKHFVYVVKGDELEETDWDGSIAMMFFIGDDNGVGYYAEDPKGKIVEKFNDQLLEGKMVYFIRSER
jgi:hypothetical protein